MEKTQEGFANWTKSQVHSTRQGWLQCKNNSLNIVCVSWHERDLTN